MAAAPSKKNEPTELSKNEPTEESKANLLKWAMSFFGGGGGGDGGSTDGPPNESSKAEAETELQKEPTKTNPNESTFDVFKSSLTDHWKDIYGKIVHTAADDDQSMNPHDAAADTGSVFDPSDTGSGPSAFNHLDDPASVDPGDATKAESATMEAAPSMKATTKERPTESTKTFNDGPTTDDPDGPTTDDDTGSEYITDDGDPALDDGDDHDGGPTVDDPTTVVDTGSEYITDDGGPPLDDGNDHDGGPTVDPDDTWEL